MTRIQKMALALLSALLLSVPFFQWGTGWLLFVAFVPLLLVEDQVSAARIKARNEGSGSEDAGRVKRWGLKRRQIKSRRVKGGRMIWYALLCFGVFVLLTTWWIYYATPIGPPATFIVNGGYMTLTFLVFHQVRRRLGDRLGYASFVAFWMAFEFLYLRAQINFPWLILGNGFANDVLLIQWYEWTGALGGSLWVLVTNLLAFKLVKAWRAERATPARCGTTAHRKLLTWVLGVLLIPMAVSVVRYLTYREKGDAYEMVVLQPNIDPYMKFQDLPQEKQTEFLLHLADSLVTPETDYIVGPETFINSPFVWESSIDEHPEILKLKAFMQQFPRAHFVIGASTWKLYEDPADFTPSSRIFRGGPERYDYFNSALQIDSSGEIPLYRKSMLVTGVEKMPYKEYLAFLENLVVNLGGAMRSNGTQEFRDAFPSPLDSTRVGPVICWESVFGEYVTDYVGEAGANFLFIITNDGWWRNTAGYRQHNSFARLRAIETRRSVARSANTGISSLIDQRGVELARIGWWERSGIRGTLYKNDKLTFYVKHGDYLGRMAVLVAAILLLYSLVFKYIKR
jgi:apolipoprotein N-acyltransferase